VVFEKAQHVVAPDVIQLAGLDGFDRPDGPLRKMKMMTEGLHAGCRSILGLKLNACSIHPVRSGQD